MLQPARSISLALLSIGGLVVLPGCPAPQEKFDNFVGRLPDGGSGGGDDAAPSKVYDVTGTFLLSIAAGFSPDTPLQNLATQKLTANSDGTATLDITLQPLTTKDRKPTGKPATKSGIVVDATGHFVADLGQQTVPGDANPVTPGADIVATIVLTGTLRSPDRLCGTVTGMVTMPAMLDLAGSTFSSVRVTDVNNLPRPESSCPAMMGSSDAGTMGDMVSSPDVAAMQDAMSSPDAAMPDAAMRD